MVDDFLLQYLRRRQIVQIIQAVVLQPEQIQTGLVARDQRVVAEVSERLDFLASVAVARIVASDSDTGK